MSMQLFTLSSPRVTSIADDLRLTPQARKVLAHLESGKSISSLEAMHVYGIMRLAARISEIVKRGYEIRKTERRDEAGQRYVRYSLY